jgi:hypothetical protein
MHDYKRLFATHATLEYMQKYASIMPATLRHISGNEYALSVSMAHKAWADKFVDYFDDGEA